MVIAEGSVGNISRKICEQLHKDSSGFASDYGTLEGQTLD